MIGKALLAAITGYAVVFFGLILLMCVVIIMGKVMTNRKATASVPAAPAAAPAETKPALPAAPGAAGELKLYDTDPKIAAMIMAITASKLEMPLNELRFKSIKEVK